MGGTLMTVEPRRNQILVPIFIVSFVSFVALWFDLPNPLAAATTPRVGLGKPPHGGIQPQAAVDNRGVLHLIYLSGQPSAADIYYVRQAPGSGTWSAPIRVNSRPHSAVAIGTIRGA